MYGELVMTTDLDSNEQVATKVYTREIFKEVKKKIDGKGYFTISSWVREPCNHCNIQIVQV